ncbi:sarcosine oxidase subunit gamma family protein [Actinomycetospora chibensis]|uniref:Sarcosine oxidase subunit gamma family protein n=1 Tax=Actinomycetospora chibensis TaxID=663606 RepID=A0ABV9RC91_9PSEU|nr:sarcosine oxidase subunit gamma family protein [Actinomycetospora chibensis]MDD7926661.1 sarcosine oxidase subunit gamma family protein [Actinomycetospora chibensis]
MSETTAAAVARSPIAASPATVLDGWEVSARAATGASTLSDETPLAKVLVRAPFDGASRKALGVRFGRTEHTDVGSGEVLLVGSAPGEWLTLGAPGTAPALRTALEERLAGTGEFTSVLDLTHGRALMRLQGPAATTVLAGVCAIDLADTVTPDGTALRTSVAAVVTDVVRDDVSGVRSYLLHCERSSGQYLWDALLDAGSRSAVEVTGFRGLGSAGSAR